MKTQLLKLSEIVIDGLQTRAKLNEDTVEEYSLAMQNNEDFPPLVTFHDGKDYFLADGFHRYFACETIGIKEYQCEVHNGTRKDALRYALGANTTNGLRRTNTDKVNCVRMAIREFGDLSNRAIAEMCGVSHPFVAVLRPVETVTTQKRVGLDGKKQSATKKKTKQPEATQPEVETINSREVDSKPIDDEKPHIRSADEIIEEQKEEKTDSLSHLKMWWRTASETEREEFLEWVKQY